MRTRSVGSSDALIWRRDLDFLLYPWLELEEVLRQPRFAHLDRASIDGVLDLSERVAADEFLTHYKLSDQVEPSLTTGGVQILPQIGKALDVYRDVGLFAAGFPEYLGGLGLPQLVASASFAQFAAANIATAAYPMLTVANARLIAAFGTRQQVEHFARPQIEGRWFGTMCLSEPQAGSSLADVQTRAVFEGEDELGARYRLAGCKMWISGGEQNISDNIVHLVLAKIVADDGSLPAGSGALSLFIVPKRLPNDAPNDVVVAGLNHKMGYRGTVNCQLSFGERGGAMGWRVGEPGAGLRQMFQMMNEARIGVGIGAAALGYRGYRLALRYAGERLQGRAPGVRDGAPVAIAAHPDVKRMLLAQKVYTEGALALCLYCAKLVDQSAQTECASLLGMLTPVAKSWSAEYGLAANDLAIQIHGGYGYTRDFDVEQLYRDNRLNLIHEGTTGIQAMDLLGRKILRSGESGMAVVGERIAACCARADGEPELAPWSASLGAAWVDILATTDVLRSADEATALYNASPFLAAFGHVVVAWLWLDQAIVARTLLLQKRGDADHLLGKVRACRYFFETELPRVDAWLETVESLSETAAGMPAAQF